MDFGFTYMDDYEPLEIKLFTFSKVASLQYLLFLWVDQTLVVLNCHKLMSYF